MENMLSTLVEKLADLMKDNQIKSESVAGALKLICESAEFEYGLVYGLNAAEWFYVMESYLPDKAEYPEKFAANQIRLEDRLSLARQTVTYVRRDENNSLLEKKLLEVHMAAELMIAPVVDDNWEIYGLVVFTNRKPGKGTAAAGSFVAPVSMLLRYIGARMYSKRLSQAKTTLESVLDNTGIDIYVNDFQNHNILYVNKSMAAPYGGREEFMGRKCWEVLFPGQTGPCEFCPQKNLIDENGMPTKVYTWDYQRAFDGSWFRVFSAAFRWVDGRLAHVVSSADITDNKRNEELIEQLANYDQLTGLPNRRMLVKECEGRIARAVSDEQGYLLFFDIDNFKMINDTLGHDAGDEFLIQLGEFFNSIPMLKNSIYRNGGDEFVAVIGGVGIQKNSIRSLAHFIHERFKKPWKLKKGEVYSNTSIGVACYPEDGVLPEELLQKADQAMYAAKKEGGGQVRFGYEL